MSQTIVKICKTSRYFNLEIISLLEKIKGLVRVFPDHEEKKRVGFLVLVDDRLYIGTAGSRWISFWFQAHISG